jgi:hypothetical protein
MRRASRISTAALLCALPLAAALAGCAAHHEQPGRPIEEIPRPAPPVTTPASADTVPPIPPPRPMTPSGEESMRALVLRDTSAVSKALKHCAGKALLPEMESTYGATAKLLAQTREALARGDVARARSLARNARQLVTSLECP